MSYSAFGDDDHPKPKSLAAARSRRLSDVFSRHMGVSVSRGLAKAMAGTRTKRGEPAVVQAYGLVVIRRGKLVRGIAQVIASKARMSFDGKPTFGSLTPLHVGDVIGLPTRSGTYWFVVEEPFGPTVREVEEPDIDEADDFAVSAALRSNPRRARRNSAKGKLAVKMAAKASGRAVPGVGQVAMVLDGAPVAAGELSDFSSQVSGSFKRQKERMKKGSYREAVMAAPGEALRAQWTLTKGVGRTALAALVAKEAAEMTKSNPNRRSFSDVYAQLLRATGTGRLMARVHDSLAPHLWAVRQATAGNEAWVYYDSEERQGNPLASHNLMVRLYPNVTDAPPYIVDAYTNAVWPWVQELTSAEREALGEAANDSVVELAEGWSTDPAASMIFVEALLADLSDHAELMVMTPVAEANPRRRVSRARMNSTKGAYPFAYKQEQYSRYTSAQLRWALRDALKARDATAHHDVAAENWYADDVHTILAELKRRGEA